MGAFALLVFIFVFWKLWKNNQANGTSISSTPRWSEDTERTISALTDTNEYTKYPNPDIIKEANTGVPKGKKGI